MAKQNDGERDILIDEKNITTVLADDIIFKGTLQFKTSLMIKGKFEGDIEATGELVVGEDAIVTATVRSNTIICYGKIIGNVEAKKCVVLAKTAELAGDIVTPDLVIQSGCKFNGNCKMAGSDLPKTAPASEQAQGTPAGQPSQGGEGAQQPQGTQPQQGNFINMRR